jgi:PPM family protein phosphatase
MGRASASLHIVGAMRTNTGLVRTLNEDSVVWVTPPEHEAAAGRGSLALVADGMGGHAAGEVASAMAVRTVHEEIKREKELLDDYVSRATGANKVTPKDIIALVETAVQRACSKIHEEAANDANKRGMGTTLSALLILGHQGFIGHVGDSRIYLSREGHVQQVTEDHTVYNELIKRGKLTKEQIEKVAQKNAITRAVGVYERVEVDTLVIEL